MYELWEMIQLSEGEELVPLLLIDKYNTPKAVITESINQTKDGKLVRIVENNKK